MRHSALMSIAFGSLAALCLASGVHAQSAQEYPARPVHIIVPFAPGGVGDSAPRVIAGALGTQLGQPVIVENRAGASGNIGTEAVAKAAPDGYTLLLGFDGTMVINPHVFSKLPWDTLRDFVPVTKLGDATLLLVAHPSLGVKNLAELLALAKTKPGPFSYGTGGTGGTPHLAGELLRMRTGVALEHVPYKGGALALNDVVGGHIPLAFVTIAAGQRLVMSGKLVALGVPSAKRSAAMPDVPTFIESGVADFEVYSWVGIFAPAKTPRAIVDRLQGGIAAALQTQEVRARYAVLGMDPVGNSPEQFAQQVRADLARWEGVVKALGLKLQ